jgi:hypothetical protein
MRRHSLLLPCAITVVSLASCASLGVRRPEPREIAVARKNVAPELVEATREDQIERGKPRPVIDGLGWFFGIPGKVILWDRRVENHNVSAETEDVMEQYLADNELDHVKVRINQYEPLEDWKRLTKNRTVGWPYRYTIGALSVAGETLFPGRLFGGDHYNPWTATIHLYSDVPSIALHEGGHAKDFTRRNLPGTYGLVGGLPFVNLWPEAIASGDAIAYAEKQGEPKLEKETYRILYPAYGTYLGGNVANLLVAPIAVPIYAGTVVAGHVAGRTKANGVSEKTNAPEWPSDEGLAADLDRSQGVEPLPSAAEEDRVQPAVAMNPLDAERAGDSADGLRR